MHIDKTGDGEITEDEFIRVWMKCESSLKDKIRNTEQEIYAAEVALSDNVGFGLILLCYRFLVIMGWVVGF